MELIQASFIGVLQDFGDFWVTFSKVWFLVLAPIAYFLFKLLWLKHVRRKFLGSIKYVMLEIIPPREIEKGPKPMESIFIGLAGILSTANPIEEFVKGKLTENFSFEIASIDGKVHFYVRTPVFFRNLVEAHFYAQYADCEIVEVPDYTEDVPRLIPNRDWDLWGMDFELTKPDPYPIRTYTSFEEDITGTMIDPLAAVIEAMGKLGPGSQLWFQLIVTPIKEDYYQTGKALIDELTGKAKKPESIFAALRKDIMDVLGNVIKAFFEPVEFEPGKEEKKLDPLEFRLSPGEKEVLKALENNVSRHFFQTKMRFIYLARRDVFSKVHVSSFIGSMKQFADMHLSGFKPNDASKTFANFILIKERLRYRQRKLFRRYRDRDNDGIKIHLSSEELATIYHMPDLSVVSPAVPRTEFKRGGAPSNLPI